jgi:hypothetical protein
MGDLDGDGDLDLACSTIYAEDGQLLWFENDGFGNFKLHVLSLQDVTGLRPLMVRIFGKCLFEYCDVLCETYFAFIVISSLLFKVWLLFFFFYSHQILRLSSCAMFLYVFEQISMAMAIMT